jgi:hypothetical protein
MMIDVVRVASDREASQTRDLSGRTGRDPFARLAWVLRAQSARAQDDIGVRGIPP